MQASLKLYDGEGVLRGTVEFVYEGGPRHGSTHATGWAQEAVARLERVGVRTPYGVHTSSGDWVGVHAVCLEQCLKHGGELKVFDAPFLVPPSPIPDGAIG
mgnify:CR=1 FL=1